MAKVRLSKRQRDVLETIDYNTAPSPYCEGKVVPVSVGQLGNTYQHDFWYENEFRRFLENLESRGFIRIEKREFIYITDAGKEAIGAAP